MRPKVIFVISSISIRNHYSTELARCINETIILIPLGDPCKLFLNGAVVTIENGIIINNADLYQLLDVHNLIEIKIPLPLFMTRDAYLVNAYFDFNRIKHIDQFKNMILQELHKDFSKEAHLTSYISKIIDYLIKEAKVPLKDIYLPQLHTKHPLLNKIIQYIHKNIFETLTTQKISKAFYISQSYISILFTKVLNINFKYYTTSLKIALSLYDLAQDNKNIYDIAAKYSFKNVSTYTKHFKYYVNMPPKRYIYLFRCGEFDIPYQPKTDHIVLSKHISEFYKHTTSNNEAVNDIDLTHIKYNHYFKDPYIVVELENMYDLLNFKRNNIESIIYSQFSKVILLIKNINFDFINNLAMQKLFNTIEFLTRKHCHLTFKITNISSFQSFNYYILQAFNTSLSYIHCLNSISLLFELTSHSINKTNHLVKRLQKQYSNLKLGICVDDIILTKLTLSDMITTITAFDVDYYYINLDFIELGTQLKQKSKQNNDQYNLRESIILFINRMTNAYSQKLIFNNITHHALRRYFNNFNCESHILLLHLLIDLNQKIGGLGYPYYSNDKNRLMLIGSHQSTMPIVHIYNLLQPFINQHVMLHSCGMVSKINNHYHLLLFTNLIRDPSQSSIIVNIYHHYSNDFPIFTRLLNQNHGIITNMISADLNLNSIEPSLLTQINKANHPLAKLSLHNHNQAITYALSNSSIQYVVIPPN